MTKLTKENTFELLGLLSASKGEFRNIRFNGHERKNVSIKDDNNIVLKDGDFVKMAKPDISEELLKFVIVSNKKLNAMNVTNILGQALNEETLDPDEFDITVTPIEEVSNDQEIDNSSEEAKSDFSSLEESSEVNSESSSPNKSENKTDKKEEKFEHNPDPKNTALLDWLFSVAA